MDITIKMPMVLFWKEYSKMVISMDMAPKNVVNIHMKARFKKIFDMDMVFAKKKMAKNIKQVGKMISWFPK